MTWYNENPNAVTDKADEVLQKMLNLKEDMVENIESLIQRDGKIDVIAEKARNLSVVSSQYRQNANKLRIRERNKKWCYYAIVAITIILIIVIIILMLKWDTHTYPVIFNLLTQIKFTTL